MILSHKYKFIFIKTRKTASTSMEATLEKYCGPDDIITPIELYPPKDYAPRNYWIDRVRGVRFYNHMTAQQVRDMVGPDVWNSYFTFCYERHPYEKTISLFLMHRQNYEGDKSEYTFENWLATNKIRSEKRLPGAPRVISDYTFYSDQSGEIIVDQVFMYDSLEQSFPVLCEKLGIPCKGLEARLKSHTEKIPVELTSDDKAFLQDEFAGEFEALDFQK